MQHVLRFTGKISWEGRANGLPKEVFAFLIFNGDDTNAINNLIEGQAAAFLRSQAMFVQREQRKIIDLRVAPQDRMVIPMRWIVKIVVDVVPLVGELSQADETGVERLKDGSKPTKQ